MRSHLLRTATRPSHPLEHDLFDGLVLGGGTGVAMLVVRIVLAGVLAEDTLLVAHLLTALLLGAALGRARSLEAGVTAAVVAAVI